MKGWIMKRKNRKRLSIDIPTYFYEEIKTIAMRRNITITRLMTKLIYDTIQKEQTLDKN